MTPDGPKRNSPNQSNRDDLHKLGDELADRLAHQADVNARMGKSAVPAEVGRTDRMPFPCPRCGTALPVQLSWAKSPSPSRFVCPGCRRDLTKEVTEAARGEGALAVGFY